MAVRKKKSASKKKAAPKKKAGARKKKAAPKKKAGARKKKKAAKKKASPADVVYSDVRRALKSSILKRLL